MAEFVEDVALPGYTVLEEGEIVSVWVLTGSEGDDVVEEGVGDETAGVEGYVSELVQGFAETRAEECLARTAE